MVIRCGNGSRTKPVVTKRIGFFRFYVCHKCVQHISRACRDRRRTLERDWFLEKIHENRSQIGPFGERRLDRKPEPAEEAQYAESTRGNSLNADFPDGMEALALPNDIADIDPSDHSDHIILWLAGQFLLAHRNARVIGAGVAGLREGKLLKVLNELLAISA